MNTDYLCENKLKERNPELHKRFRESVFGIQGLLNRYKYIFPTYTDHTALHSLEVIDFCNALIGQEQIDRMNDDEIYILLMSAYLHDSGMGIAMSDYEEFRENIDFGDYFDDGQEREMPDIIRDFHHEFGGQFIRKYGDFFDIPSKEHLYCIIQVSRGHRNKDLYDEKEYPVDYRLSNGNQICLPYLAALIRLADELDIAADRNIQFLYDISEIDNDFSRMEFKKHKAIRSLVIEPERFVMKVDTSDQNVFEGVLELREKLRETLTECRRVTGERTGYTISQEDIVIVPV